MGKYVIIGNGVTGTRAAEVLRAQLPDAEITLMTEEDYPFYRRPQLPDFVAGKVAGAALWGKRSEFYDRERLELRLSCRVEAIDAEAGKVRLASGEEVGYDSLLIATGRQVDGGGLPGEKLDGVVCLKTLDQAKALRESGGQGRRAVVYGDGLVALEMVRALTGAGFATTYAVPGPRIWPEVLDEDAADIAAARLRAAGAELVTGVSAERVAGADGRARALVLGNGTELEGEVFGVCARYRPALSFLPGDGGAFAVGEDLTTPWEGIWAAGDVTSDPSRGYFNWLRSWREGAAAGRSMAGGAAEPAEKLDLLNMQIRGLSLVAIGRTTVAYRSGFSEMRGEYPYGEFYKKLVFDPDDVLVGALLLGGIAEAGALEEAIRSRTKKADLDAGLLHQMFDRTYRTEYLGVQCPVCRHEIQLSPGAAAGDLVTCPICGVDFRLERGQGAAFVAKIAR